MFFTCERGTLMNNRLLTWRERGLLWLRLGIRIILTVIVVAFLVKLGRPLLSLFAPFVAALIFAVMLNPLIRWCQRKIGWSRHLLTLLLILLLLGAIGGVLTLLVYSACNELISLAQNWNFLLQKIMTTLDTLDGFFDQLPSLLPPALVDTINEASASLLEWLGRVVPSMLADLASSAGHKAMGFPSLVVAIIICVMATYFLASDFPYLRAKCVQHMDEGLLHFWDQVKVTALGAFGGYLKAQLLLSIGVFFILLIGFFCIGQPYSVLLALGFAILDFIPLIGAGTIMVPWAVISLFTRDLGGAVELMIIWGVIVLFRRVMEPKIVGDQTGLSPILSLISIYVGMRVGGVLGMILGPILTLVVLNLTTMGIFHGIRLDIVAAAQDVSAILSQHPAPRE